MNSLKLLGRLFQTSEGEIVYIPDSNAVRSKESGKIVKQPTPEDVAISKEREEDYSLDGRLKKVSEKEV